MNTDTSVGSTGYPPPAYYGNGSAGAGWDAEIGGGSSVRFGVRDGSKQTLTAVLAGGLAGAYLTTVGTLARNWCFSGDPPEDTLPQTILGGLAVVGFAGLACYQYNRREGGLEALLRLNASHATQSYQAGFQDGRYYEQHSQRAIRDTRPTEAQGDESRDAEGASSVETEETQREGSRDAEDVTSVEPQEVSVVDPFSVEGES